jgi:hypothetical protein
MAIWFGGAEPERHRSRRCRHGLVAAASTRPGEANKVFLIPSEFSQAFGGLSQALERRSDSPPVAPEANGKSRSRDAGPRAVNDDGPFGHAA